jgi:hypothetical protein
MLTIDYILPFLKLKGLSPITIEIRTDKPIVFEQKIVGTSKVVFTVAARVECENE